MDNKKPKSAIIAITGDLVAGLDMFGAPMPALNVKGKTGVKTLIGGLMSVLILGTTFAFALLKFQHMMQKKGPTIIQLKEEGALDEETIYEIADSDFMMAISIDHWLNGLKLDPSYIKFVSHLWYYTGTEFIKKSYPMHVCTADEYQRFYEPRQSAGPSKIDELKEKDAFYCLGAEAMQYALFGNWASSSSYKAIEINAIPCATQYTSAIDGSIIGGGDECVKDLESSIEYFGSTVSMTIMYNDQKFLQKNYDEDRVFNFSSLKSIQLDFRRSEWFPAYIDTHELIDETNLVQIGTVSDV